MEQKNKTPFSLETIVEKIQEHQNQILAFVIITFALGSGYAIYDQWQEHQNRKNFAIYYDLQKKLNPTPPKATKDTKKTAKLPKPSILELKAFALKKSALVPGQMAAIEVLETYRKDKKYSEAKEFFEQIRTKLKNKKKIFYYSLLLKYGEVLKESKNCTEALIEFKKVGSQKLYQVLSETAQLQEANCYQEKQTEISKAIAIYEKLSSSKNFKISKAAKVAIRSIQFQNPSNK